MTDDRKPNFAGRDAAFARLDARAGATTFNADFRAHVVEYAPGQEIDANEIRADYERKGLPAPPHPNCWGRAFASCCPRKMKDGSWRRGFLERIDTVPSTNERSNGSMVRRYRRTTLGTPEGLQEFLAKMDAKRPTKRRPK